MSMSISLAEFEQQVRLNSANWLLIDVRNPNEYALESIPGSRNIPLTDLSDAFADLDTDEHIVFICQSGMRSLKAVNFAHSVGFINSKSLEGGINAWSKNRGV